MTPTASSQVGSGGKAESPGGEVRMKPSPASRAVPSPAVLEIAKQVARTHSVKLSELLSKSRHKYVVRARQETMWRAARELGVSLPIIGASLGRDHATVLFGIRKHEKRVLNGEAA